MELSRAIIGMLKENTGCAMGDSGNAYGRNWERNATVNIKKQPSVVAEFSKGGISVTRNVYHFLMENLQRHDVVLQRKFNAYCKSKKHSNEYPITQMEGFARSINDDNEHVYTVNTYNGECNLSQTLQFVNFKYGGESYVLLQIHGGCDVRGGYTEAKVFALEDYYLGNVADAYISCSSCDCDANWHTDNDYHYYVDGAYGVDAEPHLENYEVVEVEDASEAVSYESLVPKLVVDKKGNGYCPHCHSQLIVS